MKGSGWDEEIWNQHSMISLFKASAIDLKMSEIAFS